MKRLVIIGGGPGGYETALEASKNGLDVTLIEKDSLGGVCLNQGCIPTKSLLHGAINGLSDIVAHSQNTIENLKNGISFSLAKAKVKLVNGKAILITAHSLKVNEEVIEFDYLIIATGAKNKTLGYNLPTHIDLLKLETIPSSLCIIGGGVIGIEFASLYLSLGSKIKIIEFQDEILPGVDKEAAKRLRLYLKKLGVEFYLKSKVTKVEGNDITLDDNTIVSGEMILEAIGRTPNLEALNFATLGIELDRGVKVNQFFQTNIPHIYAIGDCTGQIQLAHKAIRDGKVALYHILDKNISLDPHIPSVVYGLLELASVGKSESECIKENIEYRTIKIPYLRNGKALCERAKEGFVKLIVAPTNHLLGAVILGIHADILLQEILTILHFNGRLEDIVATSHAHPSLSELILEAAKEGL